MGGGMGVVSSLSMDHDPPIHGWLTPMFRRSRPVSRHRGELGREVGRCMSKHPGLGELVPRGDHTGTTRHQPMWSFLAVLTQLNHPPAVRGY